MSNDKEFIEDKLDSELVGSNISANSHQSDSTENAISAPGIDDKLAQMQSEQWSRVSPLAIVYFFVRTIYFLVSNVLVYSLPGLVAAYSSIKRNPEYLIIGVCVFLGLILLGSILKYWFYQYKFTRDRVEIKQGVFKKSHLDLPFKKIQNVKIVQPFYYRFNQYSYIELDTAGSASQEAKIVALPLILAESFKQLILQIKQATPNVNEQNQSASPTTAIEQEQLLNQRSLKDLIIHGISNNRVWIFLGFLAPFYETIGKNIGVFLDKIGFDIVAYLDYQSQSIGMFILHVLSLVMLIMLLIVSFSVLGSIFVFYKYRLSRLGDRYIRRSGLLTKQEVSMRLSRIQIAVQQQDWLDVIINRTNLRFEQNASLAGAGAQAGNINNASKLIVPSVTPKESIALIKDAFDVTAFNEISFANISKRYIIRKLAFPILPLLIPMYAIAFFNDMTTLTGWVSLASVSAILIALVGLRWFRWGYYFSPNSIYIRKGLFGVNYYVFPVGKSQQVKFKQSLLMRPHQLADIHYVLASGAHKIPLIPEHIAIKQADEALLVVARDKPAWM